tara:strand:+ start:114 stop:1190 length:1077 start_codon:yes stop_codon:yes gene_type:complete
MISLALIRNKKFKIVNKTLKKLKSDHCRINILASGICASDIPRAYDSMAYHYPLVLGHEFVGRITEIGNRVTKFNRGDIVSAFPLVPCCLHKKTVNICENCNEEKFNLCNNYSYYGSRTDGSFAEFLDVNQWNLFKVSKNLPFEHSSLIEPLAVVFNIISKFKNDLNNKKKVLILGAGFLGQILARVLKKIARHHQVHILDRNRFKLNLGKKFSTAQYLTIKEKENLYLKKKLNSKFDIVIETTGNNECFKDAIIFVKKDGKVFYSGNINESLVFKKNEVSDILRKQINIKGVWNSSFKSNNNNWNQAHSFLLKSKELEELITHEINLENSAQLLDIINEMKKGKRKNDYVKGIIKNY